MEKENFEPDHNSEYLVSKYTNRFNIKNRKKITGSKDFLKKINMNGQLLSKGLGNNYYKLYLKIKTLKYLSLVVEIQHSDMICIKRVSQTLIIWTTQKMSLTE